MVVIHIMFFYSLFIISSAQCQHLRVRPLMKGMKKVTWSLKYDGDNPMDDMDSSKLNKLKEFVKKYKGAFYLRKNPDL